MVNPEPAPHLDLSFRRHPIRGTWLDRRLFRWPYALSRSFRLQPDALTVILQTSSGAIQSSDRLVQRIHVGPQASVNIATQGAMAVHRAQPGQVAQDDVTLDVEDNASLAYMPDLRILFPDSNLSQRFRLTIAESATAVIADGFITHDPHGQNRPFHRYRSEITLQRPDGRLLSLDRTTLDAPPHSRGKRAGYTAFGTLLVAAGRPAEWARSLCTSIDKNLATQHGLYSATSALPNGAGAMSRVAALDGRHLRLGLQAAWQAAGAHLAKDHDGI